MTKTIKVIQWEDDDGVKGEGQYIDTEHWLELRKIQGKDKGKTYIVPRNQVIKLPSFCVGREILIYVEAVDELRLQQ